MATVSSFPKSLSEAALRVLCEPTPADKVDLTRRFAKAWQAGEISDIGSHHPPDRPARPGRPELKPPDQVPRRGKGGIEGKRAFIHAIAHIELNAIDLAWDIVCRFTDEDLPPAFYDDWVGIALDEAEHFDLLLARLHKLGGDYGDLSAHDGLWEAAQTTNDDLAARLALVPMILEARGLDTTPIAVQRFRDSNDQETADILDKIGNEEIPHVAAGVRWFEFLCHRCGIPPVATFHKIVTAQYKGRIKPHFIKNI